MSRIKTIGSILLVLCAMFCSMAQSQEVVETERIIIPTGASTTVFHTDRPNTFALTHTIELLWSSVPTSPTVTISGCMRGGTCVQLVQSVATTNSLQYVSGVFDNYKIVTTWTGALTLTLNITGHVNSQVVPTGQSVVANANQVVAASNPSTQNADGQANVAALITSPANNNQPLSVAPFQYNGATWDRTFYCPNTSKQTISATTTELVPLTAAQKIRVCSLVISRTDTAAVVATGQLVEGTGVNCVTGQTTLTGVIAAFGSGLVGTQVYALESQGAWRTNVAADALCFTEAGAASSMDVTVTWAKY